jgi:aryl-alcohol dehydrogenase-like predicted oxidoreductase
MNFYDGERHLDFRTEYIEFALTQSLRRLGTECIDLYQVHNPRPQDLTDELFALLDRLRQQGKIRYYGVSLNSRMEGFSLLKRRGITSLQVMYNLLDRRAGREILPWARAHRVAGIARVPLASGLLTGKYAPTTRFRADDQRHRLPPEWLVNGLEAVHRLKFLATEGRSLAQAALGFVLANPAVTVAIPGARSPAQVEHNVAALSAAPLTPVELSRIAAEA